MSSEVKNQEDQEARKIIREISILYDSILQLELKFKKAKDSRINFVELDRVIIPVEEFNGLYIFFKGRLNDQIELLRKEFEKI